MHIYRTYSNIAKITRALLSQVSVIYRREGEVSVSISWDIMILVRA
jgi:hypothetical protein